MSIVLQGVHPKLIEYVEANFIGGKESILDWSYSDLGDCFAKTLFLKMKSGFIYTYSYCDQGDSDDIRFSFEVYNPKEIEALRQII